MERSYTYLAEQQVFHGRIPWVMGTRFDLLLCAVGERPATALWQAVCGMLEQMNRMLDRFNPTSEVGQLNAGKTRHLSSELQEVLEICAAYWLRTEGLFDITRRDFTRLHWQVGSLDTGGVDMDFGGIAKGLALRQIQDLIGRRGITAAFADFGGSSLLAVGRHPYGPCWKVSLPDPYTGETLAEMELKDISLSTSGNRPDYSGHILHPRDGQPCRDRRLVCVTAPDPLDAEVLSTALMLASPEQRERLEKQFPLAETQIYER